MIKSLYFWIIQQGKELIWVVCDILQHILLFVVAHPVISFFIMFGIFIIWLINND